MKMWKKKKKKKNEKNEREMKKTKKKKTKNVSQVRNEMLKINIGHHSNSGIKLNGFLKLQIGEGYFNIREVWSVATHVGISFVFNDDDFFGKGDTHNRTWLLDGSKLWK